MMLLEIRAKAHEDAQAGPPGAPPPPPPPPPLMPVPNLSAWGSDAGSGSGSVQQAALLRDIKRQSASSS
eukprot:COSAG03_NODE_2628_length_2582_cov_1.782924_4_plen_68_part_01